MIIQMARLNFSPQNKAADARIKIFDSPKLLIQCNIFPNFNKLLIVFGERKHPEQFCFVVFFIHGFKIMCKIRYYVQEILSNTTIGARHFLYYWFTISIKWLEYVR